MKSKFRYFWAGIALAGMCSMAQAADKGLTWGMVLEPPMLDPTAGAAAAIDEVVYANVFEGLTRINANGEVLPALASSWNISDDGLTYTFKLHSGVTFHDGTEMDSADVVFSMNRAMAEDSVNAQKALFEPIEKVEAAGADTVVFTLKRPTGGFLFNLGWGDMVIVGEESAATNGQNPVGTGPFRFESWLAGDNIKLVKNDNYWGTSAQLSEVTFKFISDPGAGVAALLAGDVDGFANSPSSDATARFQSDDRFQVVVGSTEGETILAINNKQDDLKNLKVRQALCTAIDRQAIIDGAMGGFGTPIGTHFAPHNPAYVDLTGQYAYNPEKAKALLSEAGYADGLKIRMHLPPPAYARRGGEIIAAQLRAIGVEAEIIPVEWAQWLSEVFRGKNFDLTIVSHTEPRDIGIYGRDDYYFNYQSDAFKSVMAKLDAETDETKRAALYGEAQKILTDDSVNCFLFELPKVGIWSADLQGVWANSPVQANDFTAVSWK